MENIKGLIFDYGGTLDTAGTHWAEVLFAAYEAESAGIRKPVFREAYVFAERELARRPVIVATDTFLDVLLKKVDIETRWLADGGFLVLTEPQRQTLAEAIARRCYDGVCREMLTSRRVLRDLAQRYPLVLVSNFYGNIETILRDFGLDMFRGVVESAVVGVRKPDPKIFQLGIDALSLAAGEVAVVGDSYSKDIVPAHSLGCHTVWFRGIGWGQETVDESLPDHIITALPQLLKWL